MIYIIFYNLFNGVNFLFAIKLSSDFFTRFKYLQIIVLGTILPVTRERSIKKSIKSVIFIIIPPLPEGGGGYTVLPLSVCPFVQDIFRRIFLSNCWLQKSDIWSQASYRYTILWVAFLDPSDSYFLFADLVGFYTHWTYMHIYCHIFLSNYWWQKSDIWSQASYRYPILWEVFLYPSDSYFLFADFVDFYTHLTYICICNFFRRIFLSNYWWQESDIWSQASYRYAILWEVFLDPSDSYFLFSDFVGFYTHWTYMHIFRHNFLSNYWWQKSDIVGSVFWPIIFLLPVCRRAGVS